MYNKNILYIEARTCASELFYIAGNCVPIIYIKDFHINIELYSGKSFVMNKKMY